MDGPILRQWLAALDSLSYYDLLRVERSAHHDALRAAFHAFAETWHPDGHRGRHPNEQAAIGRIFRRGAEAWHVLSDARLRARYDEALANGIVRPENIIVEMDGPRRSFSSGSMPAAGGAFAGRSSDSVRSPGARPFVLRAEELLKNGDPKQAKLQLVMAMHLEPGNAALDAFGKQLDEAIAKKADADKTNWKK